MGSPLRCLDYMAYAIGHSTYILPDFIILICDNHPILPSSTEADKPLPKQLQKNCSFGRLSANAVSVRRYL
jgi:hypothetical protein